ncbi:hypothetical protein Trco_000752 [Trichoderma cornu-damae]|uniref:Uncharacterized protein n=1 Tax=Trichoderma cornu-damae TaxID=654480 RepID=A0A9P8U054_9HYPO|nr:hypothetical protein Trco_000752 [Trichoderma cornu-damae]
MPNAAEWLEAHVVLNGQDAMQGRSHLEHEADCLCDYLDGELTAEEAAISITTPLLQESNPPTELYRLMGLLCEALVELADDREKLLELLAAIQELPPAAINWSVLPGLRNMWSDLYRLHTRVSNGGEVMGEPLPDEKKSELRQHYTAIGTVEAKLYVRGLGGVTENWGYELLNLACSRRPGLEVVIGEIHAWLTVAGTKLLKDLNPDEVRNWSRPVLGGQPGQQHAVQGTMAQHWDTWRRTLLQVSEEKDFLSGEARKLARECHRLMQGHI